MPEVIVMKLGMYIVSPEAISSLIGYSEQTCSQNLVVLHPVCGA
jgi:hypothetical protein